MAPPVSPVRSSRFPFAYAARAALSSPGWAGEVVPLSATSCPRFLLLARDG